MSGEETFAQLPEDTMLLVNRICNRFEQAWQAGEQPRAETFAASLDARRRRFALQELIPLEIEYRRMAHETISVQDYATRFPDFERAWLIALCNPAGREEQRSAAMPRAIPPAATSAAAPASARSAKVRRLGDYELIAKVGSGGMGAVYKAMHRRMQRVVALKVLRADLNDKPQLLARFEREVRTAARLSHPNIVTAYDAREDKGLHYLITEYVDGDDLDRVVKQNGPLPADEAASYLLHAARGLAYAHERQVIHRDIKPANLLLDRNGVVKVLDMGLARLTPEDDPHAPPDENLTESGMIMGTAAYMAPEQARSTRHADERSDIYSLGCTLHYLLTGKPVYTGETAIDLIVAHAQAPIPALETDGHGEPVPPRLQELFRRMVAKRPEDRYQRMGDVVAELEQIVREAPTLVTPMSMPTIISSAPSVRKIGKPQRRRRRLPAIVPVAAASLLTIAVIVGVWFTFGGGEDPIRRPQDQSQLPALPDVSPTLTLESPPAMGDGRFALSFNGQNSYVAAPSLTLDPMMPVTIEAVVQVRTPRISNVVSWLGTDWIALFQSGEGNWGIGRRVGAESRLYVSTERLAPGNWTHLAATADRGELRLFVNGARVAMSPLDYELPVTDGGLSIGGVRPDLLPSDQNDRFFDGLIDSVRISRGIRYRQPFAVPSALTSDESTLALYRFETGAGNVAADESGNDHHGAIVNAPWTPRR